MIIIQIFSSFVLPAEEKGKGKFIRKKNNWYYNYGHGHDSVGKGQKQKKTLSPFTNDDI